MTSGCFVECKTAEEQLLLTLIDRTERNEAILHKIVEKVTPKQKQSGVNVLDGLMPKHVGHIVSESEEAEFAKNKLTFPSRRKRLGGIVFEASVVLSYPENIARLKKNGFEVHEGAGCISKVTWTNGCLDVFEQT